MPVLVDVEPGSGDWSAARLGGVTATDIVTILGLSSYDSVYSLFWRKLGQVPDEPDRDRFALGRHMEPYVRERWAQAQDGPRHFHGGCLWRSAARPWQMATPDYQVGPGLDYREALTGVLECKSWADADRHAWDAGPPARVRAQVLWQMDTLDVAIGHVGVVFLPSGRFESYVIEHENGCTGKGNMVSYPSLDCSICDDVVLMRDAGLEFYRRMTLELPPPDPDSSAVTLAALRARFTRSEGKQAEVEGTLFTAWSEARDVVKFWEGEARGYEIQLREQAGEAQVLTVDGEKVATRVVSDSQVKAHTRHVDYYRRVKAKGNDGE
jgi:hypothetical protein